MIIKRSKQCRNCGAWMDYFTDESTHPYGQVLRCECGIEYICISYEEGVSKWLQRLIEVEEELATNE